MSNKQVEITAIPPAFKFLFGGSAGMSATLFVHPFDLVKNRMQMSGEGGTKRLYRNSFHALSQIMKTEGILGVYAGLTGGLLRQATYATTRLGVYTTLFERMSSPDRPPSLPMKIGIAVVAGLIGSFVGTPAELVLVRMTSDGRLPVDQRRNYSNALVALVRIGREDGVLGLWRGVGPTMSRAAVVNAAQLASYSQAKQMLLSSGYCNDNIYCHFLSSMISGFVTTATSTPVDIVKTRLQNMRVINGKPEYSGAMDILLSTIRKEGVASLWKGFTPYYLRVGPHTILTFIFLEQFNKAYYRYALSK